MNKTKKIIISSVVLLSLTTGVYASSLSFSQVKTIINNLQVSSSDEIGKFGEILANLFDSNGYIKTNFINTNEIQKRISSSCPSDKAIQSINQDGTLVCVGSGAITGGGGVPTGNSVWTKNGTKAYYNDGNIGIGTTNPGVPLHINKANDVEGNSSANGVLMIGLSNGEHVSIDNNEIMAKNGNGIATLNLNLQGGDTTLGGNIKIKGKTAIFGDGQTIYGDNYSAFYVDSLHDTVTQMIFRDKQNTQYGRVYGTGNGSDFGLLDGDGHWMVHGNKNNYLRFVVANSEKMRIKSNGNIGIGTSSPGVPLHINKANDVQGNSSANGVLMIGPSNGKHISIDNDEIMAKNGNSTTSLYINYNGGKTRFGGNVEAPAFIYTSDRRLKKGIKTLSSSLEKVNKLRGVSFKWKKNGKKEIGLIAQEVEKVYPDLVVTDKESGMKAVKYGNIVAILIEGIKELYNKVMGNTDRIVVLEKENSELKNKISDLEEKMRDLEKKVDMLVR